MTVTRIATPSPTSPVTVDTFQNPGGSVCLKATMAGLGFGTTAPDFVGNERMGLGAIIRGQMIRTGAHSSQLLESCRRSLAAEEAATPIRPQKLSGLVGMEEILHHLVYQNSEISK